MPGEFGHVRIGQEKDRQSKTIFIQVGREICQLP